MTVIDIALALMGLPLLAACGYLCLLTLLWRRPRRLATGTPGLRFHILVPAHNEACGLGATLASLDRLDYPHALRRVVVVADNCSDRTADVAAAAGATVLVRTDPDRRGKGWALRHGIDRLLAGDCESGPWDALVVIDADTEVAPDLLLSLAARFEAGAAAVQVAYLPKPGSGGGVSVVTEVALTAFHLVRSAARERLGLSCGLRGNGMAFTRTLLETVPHEAFSRTEDLEFGVQLGLRDVRVVFAGDTRVWGDMPDADAVVAQQRARWIGGRVEMARRFVPALLTRALTGGSLMAADLAADLLVPPLSVLTLAVFTGLVASLTLVLVAEGPVLSPTVWVLAGGALAMHVAHAACLAGQGWALVRALRVIPAYAWSKARTTLAAFGHHDGEWVRTARAGDLAGIPGSVPAAIAVASAHRKDRS